MGINYAVSDLGDADGLAGEPIDQRALDLAEALEMFVGLTHDAGANFTVQITLVDETKVVVYYTHYLGLVPSSNPERLYNSSNYGFFYAFEKDPEDHLDTFDQFLFTVGCIVKAAPWICTERVLRRIVAGDDAGQPAA
ncbi:hypothetical protein HYX70_02275 [Candidatus Saccharibacteria bacterium]|nr:hypothetical protein [Candidatus Saccharibacteria bacterium]